ncbi:suppressor protein SRP40 [Hyalella azteca]|uniref:Suppressor protein SRP40 n=1 Tax=Hyalella azteca TaxID=294128 RepID=A0A8B7N4Y5_HYAAZ|nr:suppressor protein SRP40 [Hyalella azteca]
MACYNPEDLSPDELSCPICFEEFVIDAASERTPKLLLCLHTFCLGCIRNLVKSNKTIQCSICRTEHKDVSPGELFDNYVIVDYIKKQQEESDALLARLHSRTFNQEPVADYEYQQREYQVEQDAAYARTIQSMYDEQERVDRTAVVIPDSNAKQLPALQPASCGGYTKPTSSTHVAPETIATTSQATVETRRQTPAPDSASRSVTPDASASSSSTSCGSTSSTTTTSSDTTSSDDQRSSSAASVSSHLEDEFVDSVEIVEMNNDRIDLEVVGSAEDDASGTAGMMILSPTLTNYSGFSTGGRLGEDDNPVIEELGSELGEDSEDAASAMGEAMEESDVVSNMDALETFNSSLTIDGDEQENSDPDMQVIGSNEGSHRDPVVGEDELFDNFDALESNDINTSDETDNVRLVSHGNVSSESDNSDLEDSCVDLAAAVETTGQESHNTCPGLVDFDDSVNTTITINDSDETDAHSVVLRNEYNGVLTRSAAAKLRREETNMSA